jgi:hypothetical protein
MIINPATNTLFLECPKTGSTSVRLAYIAKHGEHNYYYNVWTHCRASELERVFRLYFTELTLADFNIYCFYREPVERFVSAWRFSVSQWETSRTVPTANYSVYEKSAAIIFLMRGLPFDKGAKPSLDDVTLDEYIKLKELGLPFPTHDLVNPQTYYFTEETTLLNFANYEQEYLKLIPLLDLPPVLEGESVPKANTTNATAYMSQITPAQLGRIKALCAEDYAAFSARGITFAD